MQILKDEVRERIIAAAAKEFMRQGYRRASTRRIAQKARIGKSNLYNYFGSKEELFSALIAPFHESFRAFLDEVTGHVGAERLGVEAVEDASRSIAAFIRANREAFITIMEGSDGTRYQGYKEEVTDSLARHFAKHLRGKTAGNAALLTRFVLVVSRLFLEALLALARRAETEAELSQTIALYLKYHMVGMAQFY